MTINPVILGFINSADSLFHPETDPIPDTWRPEDGPVSPQVVRVVVGDESLGFHFSTASFWVGINDMKRLIEG